MVKLRLMVRLLMMVPLEGAICVLALAMVFAGVALQWGIPLALVSTGLILLFLEFWPAIAARKG